MSKLYSTVHCKSLLKLLIACCPFGKRKRNYFQNNINLLIRGPKGELISCNQIIRCCPFTAELNCAVAYSPHAWGLRSCVSICELRREEISRIHYTRSSKCISAKPTQYVSTHLYTPSYVPTNLFNIDKKTKIFLYVTVCICLALGRGGTLCQSKNIY